MKAAIYCRVSSEDQKREGTSLSSQLDACLKEATLLGCEVPQDKIFTEVWSGLDRERPDFTSLRESVRKKEIDYVIFNSVDRFARDPVPLVLVAEDADKAGVTIRCIREPFENTDTGRLILYILGYASKLEAERIKERSLRGKHSRAALGKLPSGTGRKLYGYDYMKGKGIGEGIRYVNEAEAKWVRQIFGWLVNERLTVNGITRRLRALEVPTPGGGEFWRRQTVYRMLTNPAYIGKTYSFTKDYIEPKRRRKPNAKRRKTGIVWKPKEEWVEIPGATPRIVSDELFEATQKILKRNKELASRNAKRQYLLAGYVFCRHCSARYIGYVKKWKDNGKPNEQRYYRCGKSQSIASPNRCNNKQLNAPRIEAIVWNQIETLLSKPEVVLLELERKEKEVGIASQQFTYWQSELQGIDGRVRNLEKQKDRVWKAFELTGDEEKFKKDIAQFNEDRNALLQNKASLEEKIKAFEQCQVDIEGIKQACHLVKDNLVNFGFEEKRLALEALQIRVLVDGDSVNIEGSIPVPKLQFESSASK
jgi:site-specific DNA recombinase